LTTDIYNICRPNMGEEPDKPRAYNFGLQSPRGQRDDVREATLISRRRRHSSSPTSRGGRRPGSNLRKDKQPAIEESRGRSVHPLRAGPRAGRWRERTTDHSIPRLHARVAQGGAVICSDVGVRPGSVRYGTRREAVD